MKNFKSFMKMYVDDFNEIAKAGKKDNQTDAKIEELQEKYFEALIRSMFKASNMPKKKQIEIAERVLKKVKHD